jgi:hypothetical protein
VSIYTDHGGDALPELVSQELREAAHPLTEFAPIEELADGGPLRLELADATPCPPVSGYALKVELELDTGKLQKQVGGCAMEAREPFQSLMSLLEGYRN